MTPSISISPYITPSVTPSVTLSVTPSITPSVTPSITPSIPLKSVDVYAKIGASAAQSCTIYYRIGFNGTPTVLTTLNNTDTTCSLRGTITNIPYGSQLYIGFKSSLDYITYNAVNSTTCPSNQNTYCGTDYNLTIDNVTSNNGISLTAYVTGGAYETCTPIYTVTNRVGTGTPSICNTFGTAWSVAIPANFCSGGVGATFAANGTIGNLFSTYGANATVTIVDNINNNWRQVITGATSGAAVTYTSATCTAC